MTPFENAIARFDAEAENVKEIALWKSVIDHLKAAMEADETLAERAMREEKTLKRCIAYITNHARREAVNGAAMVEDATVYRWAIEYFQADNLDEDKNKPAPAPVQLPSGQEGKKAVEKPAKKIKPKPSAQQLAFDFGDDDDAQEEGEGDE